MKGNQQEILLLKKYQDDSDKPSFPRDNRSRGAFG